jgi:hypothetical protein
MSKECVRLLGTATALTHALTTAGPKKMKKLLLSTLLIMLVILVPLIASAISGANPIGDADGRIVVLIDGEPMKDGPTMLKELIAQSEAVRSATAISTDGYDVPLDRLWATPQEHNALIAVEKAAEEIYKAFPNGWFAAGAWENIKKSNYSSLDRNEGAGGALEMWGDFALLGFAPGDVFDFTLEIEGNPSKYLGFSGMYFTLELPPQLEFEGTIVSHVIPQPWPASTFDFFSHQTGNTFVGGWASTIGLQNYTGRGLITFRLRVAGTMPGLTPPIVMYFRNRLYPDTPTYDDGSIRGRELDIVLPGLRKDTAEGPIYEVGGILIREP